jgi:hypothetical protein
LRSVSWERWPEPAVQRRRSQHDRRPPAEPQRRQGQGVTAAAYTNNDLNGDTATTLFDIDPINDQVAIQAPPNNGTLNPTG